MELLGKTFTLLADEWFQKTKQFGGPRNRYQGAAERTQRCYKQMVKRLKAFDFKIPMNIDQIRGYQEKRSETASGTKINQEVTMLKRILKFHGVWLEEIEKEYVPLARQSADTPEALTPAQQSHWLRVCQSQVRWHVIYWYSLVVLNSTSSSYEMRQLRLKDVPPFRNDGLIFIRWGKNSERERTAPLGPDGILACEELVKIAKEKGCCAPEHFLFPKKDCGISQKWNPKEHISDWGLVKLWNEVRAHARETYHAEEGTPPFPVFQCNALRHTALTRYAEAGYRDRQLIAMAGHIDEKMLKIYVQISDQAKIKWAADMARKKLPSSAMSSTAELLMRL